jgi:hypothetical protein
MAKRKRIAKAPSVQRYEVHNWIERDRIGIWVDDTESGEVIFQVWDDEARQLFDDGFLKTGKMLEESVLEYLKEIKVI